MVDSFFITDPAKRAERDREIAERDERHRQDQVERAAYAVAVRDTADEDLHAAQVLAVAKLVRPGDFASHDNFKEMARRELSGPRGNTEQAAKIADMFERNANSSLVYPIDLAERVIELVRSWR